MATFLDTGLLEYFSVIFPALLVFVVLYGLFEKIELLGKNKALHAMAAIVVAFLVMLSEDIVALISFIAPWFVVFFIFVVLMLVVYKSFGLSDKDISSHVWNDSAILWTVFVIGGIIVAAAIASVYGQRLIPLTQGEEINATDSSDFAENVGGVVFHPKVVGLIFILGVAVFAVGMLTKEAV